LADGDFEAPPTVQPEGWQWEVIPSLDDVDCQAKRVANEPREGKQCLMLKVTPKNPLKPPQVLERTFVALHGPALRLEPGTVVRVSAWMRVPAPIVGSPDGALLFDSAGGEPLAVRTSVPCPWKQFILYRTVPASGVLNVTLALSGIGTVYFDDVRIEPMTSKNSSGIITTSSRPRQ
jgi:hypothetical protein